MTTASTSAAATVRAVDHCHRPGRHCGSSAIRDLLEFHGLAISEACCFGLGAGLGITYVRTPGTQTPFMVHVRSMGFEEKVFSILDTPFQWSEFADKESASAELYCRLHEHKPALLLTDIYHLPYFNSSTRFPGHAIVAWHLDEQAGQVMVSDTERPGLLAVPLADLQEARFSLLPPFIHKGSLFAPDKIDTSVTPRRIRQAIIDNAVALAQGNATSGLAALATWRHDLPIWAAEDNWRWLLRFGYQVIEKRGTGGAGFRAMYAEFLREAELLEPAVAQAQLVELMTCCADAWSALASEMKRGSESEVFPIDALASAISEVERHESGYVSTVLRSLA